MEKELISALNVAAKLADAGGAELAVRLPARDKLVVLSHVNEALRALTALKDKLTRPSDAGQQVS